MKGTRALSVLVLLILAGASLRFTQIAFSSSHNPSRVARRKFAVAPANPYFATNLNVDRTDDVAAASACTGAANDCSLRGAIINANAAVGATPIIINLQAATTYNLTLANSTQENGALTGDLDVTTSLHSVTIMGGGASTVINAAGLNGGSNRDRAFQIVAFGATVVFQDLTIENGKAADDGTPGETTNPANQTSNGMGGCIFNGGGDVTLTNVTVQNCQALGRGDTVENNPNATTALGGGLASTFGDVIITGSTFTGDSAQGGNGGNFNNGAGAPAKGGSIYLEAGSLNLDGSRIENSSAIGGNGGSVSQDGDRNGGFGGMAQGGGIFAISIVTVNHTTFENTVATGGNSGNGGNGSEPAAEADGGGIYSLASLTVNNSTFHLAAAHGGNGGNAFGNTCLGGHSGGDGGAGKGGAIVSDNLFMLGASAQVNSSTFANNSATGGNGGSGGQIGGGCGQHGQGGLAYGGAVANENGATLNIKHATISGNNAQAGNTGVNQGGANKPPRLVGEGTGGGIRVGPGTVTIANTIVAGNTAANGLGDTSGAPVPGPDVDGSVTSSGHNLVGNVAEALGFTGPGDQTGVNPLLAALANNGGPTFTMALNPGSPAIDAGVAAGATTDQRGLPRTVDDAGVPNTGGSDGTDIGAYEAAVSCTLDCPANITQGNDADECGATVTFTTPGGDGCGTVTCDHPSGSFFAVGTTTVQCTSSAGPTCDFTVTVNDTQSPTITAPANASYQCPSEVPVANPNQATASDNCAAPTVTVSESNNGGAGSIASPLVITRTYTAKDGAGLTSSASQTITVIDNTPPVISCPANITVNAVAGTCAANVSFSVAASDNCSSPTVGSDHLSGSSFPVGTTMVNATATDAAGNTSSCSFTVTVNDITPPVINLIGNSVNLWPPNHEYATVNVADLVASASDLCDAGVNINSVVIASVSSDEPNNSVGEGSTTNDIVIAPGCKSVQLVAERMGGGNGRVYTITFKVTDSSGNSTTATAKVMVPKTQNGNPAVDDGPQYTVNGCP